MPATDSQSRRRISEPALRLPTPPTRLRPIPLLITDGGGANNPDSFVVYYSVGRTFVSAANITATAFANQPYQVQSANGFKKGDVIVAISNPSAIFPANAPCYTSVITDAVPPPAAADGIVTITHSGAPVAVFRRRRCSISDPRIWSRRSATTSTAAICAAPRCSIPPPARPTTRSRSIRWPRTSST